MNNRSLSYIDSGCNGPIGVQNHANEFYNWGFDSPTGHYIKFNDSKDELGVVIPDIPQSKPRLAVSMEYADLFLRDDDKNGVFELIESKQDRGTFSITLNEKAKFPDLDIIERVTLYVYIENKAIAIEGTVKLVDGKIPTGNGSFILDFGPSFYRTIERRELFKLHCLIRFSFKQSTHTILKRYNHSSGWIYPATLFSRQKIALKLHEEAMLWANDYDPWLDKQQRDYITSNIKGYRIERHDTWGEVPNLKVYRKLFKHEYE